MKLLCNGCEIVLEWLFIDMDLVFYGLGDYASVIYGLTHYGHVTYPLLFLEKQINEYLDKNYGFKTGATKAGATRAGVRNVCGEKEVKVIPYEYEFMVQKIGSCSEGKAWR
eukprot:489973_1